MSSIDELVPRGTVAREFGVSTMTIRAELAKLPGFDASVLINGKNYHRRGKIEAVKAGRASRSGEAA
jgi:hypothetical protein